MLGNSRIDSTGGERVSELYIDGSWRSAAAGGTREIRCPADGRPVATVAEAKANLISVEHVRESRRLDVQETAIELTLETRGRDHADRVLSALRDAGYDCDT